MVEQGRTEGGTRPSGRAAATGRREVAPDGRAMYRRQTPHVTQEPIVDESLRPLPGEMAPGAAPAATRRRRHMGTATSDPQYLPPTDSARGTRRQAPRDPSAPDAAPRQELHFERYLESPKPGKSIFTARQQRSRRTRLMVALILLAVVLAALVWFLFFR